MIRPVASHWGPMWQIPGTPAQAIERLIEASRRVWIGIDIANAPPARD